MKLSAKDFEIWLPIQKTLHLFRPSISEGLLKRSKQTLKIDMSEQFIELLK